MGATLGRRKAKLRGGSYVKESPGQGRCLSMSGAVADDGRAVWSYGDSIRPGEPHIVWHAIGTHAVLP